MASKALKRKHELSVQQAHRLGVRLARQLGKKGLDRYVAIDLRSGEPHVGDTSLQAVERGLAANPAGQFQVERIGHRVAAKMRRRG